jgi:hypothetical protein
MVALVSAPASLAIPLGAVVVLAGGIAVVPEGGIAVMLAGGIAVAAAGGIASAGGGVSLAMPAVLDAGGTAAFSSVLLLQPASTPAHSSTAVSGMSRKRLVVFIGISLRGARAFKGRIGQVGVPPLPLVRGVDVLLPELDWLPDKP